MLDELWMLDVLENINSAIDALMSKAKYYSSLSDDYLKLNNVDMARIYNNIANEYLDLADSFNESIFGKFMKEISDTKKYS
jgi:hypothetical protein